MDWRHVPAALGKTLRQLNPLGAEETGSRHGHVCGGQGEDPAQASAGSVAGIRLLRAARCRN